jgi:hypothetical protein
MEGPMETITVEYSNPPDPSGAAICMKLLDDNYFTIPSVTLFEQAAACLLSCSCETVVFDLSKIKVVTSRMLGACVALCRNQTRHIRFIFSKDARQTVEIMSIDKMALVEFV